MNSISVEGGSLFLLLIFAVFAICWSFNRISVNSCARQHLGVQRTPSTQRRQEKTHQYKLHWSFSFSWGVAWLVLAYFVCFSFFRSNVIIARIALLVDGLGYWGALVILTLPFWIILRNKATLNRQIFNIAGIGFGLYTLACFSILHATVFARSESAILSILKIVNLELYTSIAVFVVLCALALVLTYQYWKMWLKGMIYVSK